jgi:hypothetical protein
MAATVTFTGKSGKTYQYYLYPLWPSLQDKPGNYVFAHDDGKAISPKYFGESQSLQDRCCDAHERRACAISKGANCIGAHLSSSSADARRMEEQDLIGRYDPPCNRQ